MIVYEPWNLSETINYKFEAIRQIQPSLLVLGSSRMTRYRSAFAHNNIEDFYNAAIPGTHLTLWYNFLVAMTEQDHAPDVIILGLDIPSYSNASGIPERNLYPEALSLFDDLRYVYASVRRLGVFWVTRPNNMISYLNNTYQGNFHIAGLQTLSTNIGFYFDGSRFDLEVDQQRLARGLEHTEQQYEARQYPFVEGESVNIESLNITEKFLQLAKLHDVKVIVILPPFRPSFLNKMKASGQFTYLTLAIAELQTLAAEYDMPFYDFTDPAILDGRENEFTDGWHATDLMSLRIYHYLLKAEPELLSSFSDIETIESLLEHYKDHPYATLGVNLP